MQKSAVSSQKSEERKIAHPFVPHPAHKLCAVCDRGLSIHSSVWRPKDQTAEGAEERGGESHG